MKKAILFASVALVAATSCNPWQGEIDQANKTSDSLRTVLAEERQISQQMSDLFEEVNANMKQIKEVELGVLNDKGRRQSKFYGYRLGTHWQSVGTSRFYCIRAEQQVYKRNA